MVALTPWNQSIAILESTANHSYRIHDLPITRPTMNAVAAIQRAEHILPGEPAPAGRKDPRWQAIVSVGRFVENEPEEVWEFVDAWGSHPQEDLRDAVATCLVDQLLELHFDDFFPLIEERSISDAFFADMFLRCSKFGLAADPRNAKRIDALQRQLSQKFFD